LSASIFDEHLAYWVDEVKIDRYRRALAEVVTDGATVLDLGSGTGLLGLLACEAGASKVYSVESGPIAALAQEVFERNGVDDRVEIIRGMSNDVTLPESVDVVVGDQIGGLAYSAGVFKYYADVAERSLKPGGVTVPASFDLAIAAVEHLESRRAIATFGDRLAGFDLTPVHHLVQNTVRTVSIKDQEPLLSQPVFAHSQSATDASRFRMVAKLEVEREGTLDGVAGMFTATMSPSVRMSNVPGHPDQMGRRWQDLFPVDHPTPVRAGDVIDVEIVVNPDSYLATWTIVVQGDAGGSRERHSTFLGQLLDPNRIRLLAGQPTQVTPLGRAAVQVIAARSEREIDVEAISTRLAETMPHLQRSEIDRMVRGLATILASGPTEDGSHG
jgi:type I protein arginine methyltransferase